jgi:SsrA-binding protein
MTDISVNRRASFDYEFLDRYDAGLVLTGQEAKSARAHRANIVGSFVIIRGGEAFLVNANIPPYQAANTPRGYDPTQTRKLLLHKRELNELVGETSEKGLTLVPIRLYTKGSRVKLEFALSRKKKQYDKRAKIRERDIERETRRNR